MWLWKWVGVFTWWENPIESIAIVRLLFPLSMWILKYPTMRILSEYTTKVGRKSHNLGIKIQCWGHVVYIVHIRVTDWVVFQFGCVRWRTRTSNDLNSNSGLGEMSWKIVATPPPRPLLWGIWQLTWGDSFKARYSSGFGQVSVRKSISIWLSVIN